MEPLLLQPSDDTPNITLNKTKGIFKLSGNSFSEDPFAIYGRIFSWIKEYSESPNNETVFEFQLNYINTAASKQIYELLLLLEKLSKKAQVSIEWYYMEGDEDTYDEGLQFSRMFSLDFNFLEI